MTILFVYALDFNLMTDAIERSDPIPSLNELLRHFDAVTDKYDVFKIEINGDAIYMVAAGIHDQSYLLDETRRSRTASRDLRPFIHLNHYRPLSNL